MGGRGCVGGQAGGRQGAGQMWGWWGRGEAKHGGIGGLKLGGAKWGEEGAGGWCEGQGRAWGRGI